jgi:signal recognition particle subunit SEC65
MSLNITNHTLEKLENLLKELGYKVRYEKGNFKTGFCVIETSKMVVVNKFSNLESKILALSEMVKNIEVDENQISEKQKQFFYSLKQTTIKF